MTSLRPEYIDFYCHICQCYWSESNRMALGRTAYIMHAYPLEHRMWKMTLHKMHVKRVHEDKPFLPK